MHLLAPKDALNSIISHIQLYPRLDSSAFVNRDFVPYMFEWMTTHKVQPCPQSQPLWTSNSLDSLDSLNCLHSIDSLEKSRAAFIALVWVALPAVFGPQSILRDFVNSASLVPLTLEPTMWPLAAWITANMDTTRCVSVYTFTCRNP